MTVKEVLADVALRSPLPERLGNAAVSGLEFYSGRIREDFLFFAFPGAKVDGRQYALDALAKGALAVVSELPCIDPVPPSQWIQVEHGRRALAQAARRFTLAPDDFIDITGITGTNGKTTTSLLVDSILAAAGKTTALIGTIGYHVAGSPRAAANTTPESLDIFRMLAELKSLGGTHATMEISSHALALGRVHGLRVHTAVFTNLTRDHLDFHGTMDAYQAAKQMLFDGPPPPRFAVVNADDPAGRALRIAPGCESITYGFDSSAMFRACSVEIGFNGLRFDIRTPDGRFSIESKLTGHINVYNILAASGAARSLGIEWPLIARGITNCAGVPGRFERVEEGQDFLVVVDYAHTDDAVRNVIRAARAMKPKRVLTLFGCGGDRDRAKRPLMAMAAAELSDYVVLTSDNPRSEDPIGIMTDAMVGLNRFDTPHHAEPDREKAIRHILAAAQPGDAVILAGKGHETYQILKDRTIEFDDRQVARQILRGMGFARKGSRQ